MMNQFVVSRMCQHTVLISLNPFKQLAVYKLCLVEWKYDWLGHYSPKRVKWLES